MAEESNKSLQTSSSYGSKAGMKLALKLSLGYAAYVGVLVTVSMSIRLGFGPNMLLGFFYIFIIAFVFGAIPAIPIGSLTGTLLAIIFAQFRRQLTEWKVVGTGVFVGIICALLLEYSLFLMYYGNLSDIPSALKDPNWVWTPISVIALFAIVWLARQLGKPYLLRTPIA